MHILIKTDTGNFRIINTDNISFIDGNEKKYAKVYMKDQLDFPIRVGMNIENLYEVILGKKDFFELYKEDGVYSTYTCEGDEKPVNVEATIEEKKEFEKEFKSGKTLVGAMGESVSVKSDEIPSFSKKKKIDKEKKKTEEPSLGGIW